MSEEFTQINPFVIKITKHNGNWDIHPDPKHNGEINDRLGAISNGITLKQRVSNEWQQRKHNGAPDQPHFILDPTHIPFVVGEGEWVQFKCDPPNRFTVLMYKELNVQEVASDPDIPLQDPAGRDWKGPKTSVNGGPLLARIKGPAHAQRFYKITAWVAENGAITTIDPDGIISF